MVRQRPMRRSWLARPTSRRATKSARHAELDHVPRGWRQHCLEPIVGHRHGRQRLWPDAVGLVLAVDGFEIAVAELQRLLDGKARIVAGAEAKRQGLGQ